MCIIIIHRVFIYVQKKKKKERKQELVMNVLERGKDYYSGVMDLGAEEARIFRNPQRWRNRFNANNQHKHQHHVRAYPPPPVHGMEMGIAEIFFWAGQG